METILQIGEGNFLRAFAEDYLQDAVNGGYAGRAVICQPRKNTAVINALKSQDCRYHIVVRGILDGKTVNDIKPISCVSRCIDSCGESGELRRLFCLDDLKIVISNTTEAGICFNESDRPEAYPDISFPAKLTAFLHLRFKSKKAGLVFLPAELIENNGSALRECIIKYAALWGLGGDFEAYINNECSFCNTLVDRIVSGHPNDGGDPCAVACEPYKSWVIEADKRAREAIPFKDIIYTHDISPYRARKVRILNGIHTMTAPAAFCAGFDTVRDTVSDRVFGEYIRQGLKEIKGTLDMPAAELDKYASGVLERFTNPFIDHKLFDILLNSVSKFKIRCLDTIIDYYKTFGALPKILTFSMAALIAFYTKSGKRDYSVRDDARIIEFFDGDPSVFEILSEKSLWGSDLTVISGFCEAVENHLLKIKSIGMANAVKEVINEQAV